MTVRAIRMLGRDMSGTPRPVSPQRLVELLVDRIADRRPGHPLRVAFDGADAAAPGTLADQLVDPLRACGRSAIRVSARWFLRPASTRLEYGHEDPEAYYSGWLDAAALRREVLDRLGGDGDRRYLPSLWDPDNDRATRAPYQTAAEDAVLLLDGPLLLGQGLPLDFTVHLRLSAGALRRRTDGEQLWTIPALERYAAEVRPDELADVVVRADDPRHPAVDLVD
jgi:hypothetical protein